MELSTPWPRPLPLCRNPFPLIPWARPLPSSITLSDTILDVSLPQPWPLLGSWKPLPVFP